MEEKEVVEEGLVEIPDSSRREFVAKLMTAAGAIAIAGLAGSSSEAAISTIKEETLKVEAIKWDSVRAVNFKFGKLTNGFQLVLSGRPIGDAMKNAGMVSPGMDLSNASIKIEFSA